MPTDELFHIKRDGTGRLALSVEGNLFHARFGLAQQILAAALERFAALVDGDGSFERHFAFFQPLDDQFQFIDRALERHLFDIAGLFYVILRHGCLYLGFRLRGSERKVNAQLAAHQRGDVSGDRIAKRLQVVTAFQHRHDAAFAEAIGNVHQLLRRPGEVLFFQIDVGERVAVVGVETGGDDDEFGTIVIKPRQDAAFEGLAKDFAAVAGAQRGIDDGVVVAGFAFGPGAGKQRHLVCRAIHHRFVRPENFLRTVAVVHVEIDDRGARNAVFLLRVARRDGGVVEQAEAHWPRGLGVVAGWPRGDEGIGGLLRHHLIDRKHAAANRPQSSLEGARRHRGVGVDMNQPFLGRGVADFLDVVHRVTQGDDLERRQRRAHAIERLEFFRLQRTLNGAQPVGPLGMTGGRQVIETSRVSDEESGHWCNVGRLERRRNPSCVPSADIGPFPGRSAARSGALQTRDRQKLRACNGPGSAVHRSASLRAAPHPGHCGLLVSSQRSAAAEQARCAFDHGALQRPGLDGEILGEEARQRRARGRVVAGPQRSERLVGQQAAAGGKPVEPQIRRRAGERRVGLVDAAVEHPCGGAREAFDRLAKPHAGPAEGGIVARFDGLDHTAQVLEMRGDRRAARQRQLARDQIDGVNAVGAFVDRRDPRVAIELRRAGFLDEAHAAVHLHAEGSDLDADVGRKCLGDRREQRSAFVCRFARRVILAPFSAIERDRGGVAMARAAPVSARIDSSMR